LTQSAAVDASRASSAPDPAPAQPAGETAPSLDSLPPLWDHAGASPRAALGPTWETDVSFSIDIEITNRCNAKCYFCPRDQTPHQGLMSTEVFERSLSRAIEFRGAAVEILGTDVSVSLCGLGEPLLNRHAAGFVRQVREAGFPCTMSSNGALLTEKRAAALLDAGLQTIYLNVGEHDDDYERIYELPFEKTSANVERFAAMAEGRCEVYIVLVDHRRDREHLEHMRDYWGERGITRFQEFDIINRGGALFVDHMQFESLPQLEQARRKFLDQEEIPLCGAPFGYLFVGYDGQYYLCCSDWKKEVPLGSVFDTSFLDVTRQKLHHVATREPVCKTCNLDPINLITDELRALDEGELDGLDLDGPDLDELVQRMVDGSREIRSVLERLQPGVTGDVVDEARRRARRRTIPVTAT
jgi:MoaA/NifB/PqqE/SkfB family radical SAM enzyme